MTTTIDTRMLDIAQHAAVSGIGAMSLGEALTAALVLNRSDWLRERGYSIVEALERIGPEWAARLSVAARRFHPAPARSGRRSRRRAIQRPGPVRPLHR